jgi:hypothetical protein
MTTEKTFDLIQLADRLCWPDGASCDGTGCEPERHEAAQLLRSIRPLLDELDRARSFAANRSSLAMLRVFAADERWLNGYEAALDDLAIHLDAAVPNGE